jgi:hypothetical protein
MHGRACFELAQTLFWEVGRFQIAKSTKRIKGRPDPTAPYEGAFFYWLIDHAGFTVPEIALWLWYRRKGETKPPVSESQLKSRRHYVSTAAHKHRRSIGERKRGRHSQPKPKQQAKPTAP